MDNEQQNLTAPEQQSAEISPATPTKKFSKKIIAIIILAVVAGLVIWLQYRNSHNSYLSYADCVAKTQLPCRHYNVGDFGIRWKPSPYRTKEECEVNQPIDVPCAVPEGNFRETRWISSTDLPQTQKNNNQPEANNNNGDRKTYTNTVFGYSVNYPSDWQFVENNGSGCKYCLYPSSGNGAYEGRGISFVFSEPQDITAYLKNADVYNKSVASLEAYLNTYSDQKVCAPNGVAGGTAYCVSYKKITFQSMPAYLVEVGGMASGYEIKFEQNGKIYNISLPSDSKGDPNFTDLSATERQILTSYHLLKTGLAAGWKTYSNSDWGFSISYPDKFQVIDNHIPKTRPYYTDIVDIASTPDTSFNPKMSISVTNDFGELHPKFITDLQEYVTSAYPASQNNKITKITINGNAGYQIDVIGDPNVKPRHIVLQDKDKVIFDLFLPADNTELNTTALTFQFTQ